MESHGREPEIIRVPEETRVIVINTGQAQPVEQVAGQKSEDWSKLFGVPTQEQLAHEAEFNRQVAELEENQEGFNRLSPGARQVRKWILIGAGVLTVVGVISSQIH